MAKDKRIDAYIARSRPFAQPILKKLRELIHKGNPQVQETIKWGMPSFEYKGPYCSFAAFKQHAVFGFWKYKLIRDPENYLGVRANEGGYAMGNMGRLYSVKDLPPDKVLIGFVKQAKKLNDDGIKMPPRAAKPKAELRIPPYFTSALRKSKKAFTHFRNFPPSAKRDYVEWITGAKTEETRNSRMTTAVEWIGQGKKRNWKYGR